MAGQTQPASFTNLVKQGAFDADVENSINTTLTNLQSVVAANATDAVSQSQSFAQTIAGALTVDGVLTANGGTGPVVAPTAYTGAAGHVAIGFPGQWNTAELTDATAGSYTLATPGSADAGKRLLIVSTTAAAHTVTAAANIIKDGSGTTGDTINFAAHIGAAAELLALNGAWNVISYLNTTLSEQ